MALSNWHDPQTITVVILTLLITTLIFETLRQVLMRRGVAVWISDGKLFFLDFYTGITFSSVPLQDIGEFSTGSVRSFQPTGIVATLKNGGRRFIPTLLLAERADALLPRFAECLSGEAAAAAER